MYDPGARWPPRKMTPEPGGNTREDLRQYAADSATARWRSPLRQAAATSPAMRWRSRSSSLRGFCEDPASPGLGERVSGTSQAKEVFACGARPPRQDPRREKTHRVWTDKFPTFFHTKNREKNPPNPQRITHKKGSKKGQKNSPVWKWFFCVILWGLGVKK